MKRKRIIPILLALLPVFFSCIGQKDDPEEIVIPTEDPEDGSMDSGTRFFQRSLALEFTASWCQYCPMMGEALHEAKEERPGRIVEICVHQNDEMSIKAADDIVKEFKVSAWPSMVFDLDHSTKFTEHSSERMTRFVDSKSGEALCGIAVQSTLDGKNLKGSVSITASTEGDYSVCAIIVEDGILASQMGAGDNYVNNSVLKGFLIGNDIFGESVGHLGSGKETTKEFSFEVEKEDGKYRIVAYVVQQDSGKRTAVNAEQCKAGEEKGYRYEKD